MTESVQDLCTCGHMLDTHQHFRPGRDCGQCGAEVCPQFTAVGVAGREDPGRLRDRVRMLVRGLRRR